MKKLLTGTVLLVLIAFGNACSKSSSDGGTPNPPPNNTCTGATPSWGSTVKPIIAGNCTNSSSCHGIGAISGKVFWSNGEVSYTVVSANKSTIKTQVVNKIMPKNGSLSDAQIKSISCWVDGGAPEN